MSDDIRKHKPTIMAVGAHADDIEIHAGGLLEKYFHRGYEVVYVMSTNNMSGSISWLDADGRRQSKSEGVSGMMLRRKRECDDAAREWNTVPIHLDHPQRHYTSEDLCHVKLQYGAPVPSVIDGSIPSILTAADHPPSVERLCSLILEKKPEILLTHGLAQENIEHFATALLVAKAYWSAVEQGFTGAFLLWREHHTVFGPGEMHWDTYIDYTPLLDRKMELIGKHACQMPHYADENFGHRLLGKQFGVAAGCGAAEPFLWVNRSAPADSLGPKYGIAMLELIRNSR